MTDDLDLGVPLEGGVASDIRVVETAGGPLVVKRALAKLRVEADWFSDPDRSLVEVAAIEAFGSLGDADAVPAVVWTRPDEHCFAMRLVDPRLRNWKLDLLAGASDLATARRVGEILGEWHSRSSVRSDLATRFGDRRYFRELRIEPFFDHVAAALPELSDRIGAIAEAMLSRRVALVHGDYSPKNILARGREVVVLDFEVAHWGDPRFDLAFCLTHLMLKSVLKDAPGERMELAITALLAGYRTAGLPICDHHLAQITGCLLLARLYGKSPVEYRDRIDRAAIETRARHLLLAQGARADGDFLLSAEFRA